MENNQVLKRMMMSQSDESYVLPVNQLYQFFDLSVPHTFNVACLRSSEYAMTSKLSDLNKIFTSDSLMPVVGKTSQTVSFIPETQVDFTTCKVLGATLNGVKSNTIPFSDEPSTYFLEFYTTQGTSCQVDIAFIGPQMEKYHILDTVAVVGTKYLIPLQFYNGQLKSRLATVSDVSSYFTLSLHGTSDVTDTNIKVTVQEPVNNLVSLSECFISPSKIEIGFTFAQLSCKFYSVQDLFMTLLHEDSVVGSAYAFPISFKTSKSGMNFKILFYDPITGGKSTMPITLTNSIEFSTSSLFSSNVLSSISSTLTAPTSDFHKTNELLITLVSNINTVSQNDSGIVGEIQKMIPLALTATTVSVSTQLDTNLAQGSVTSEDLSNFINQVKVLSKPQFLTNESTVSTVDMINKFVDVSNKAAVWSSDSSNSLSGILVNVASKIPEKSTMKLANSIVNAAISLGSKTELSTVDFFPSGEKPSNLISINAVKTSLTLLNSNTFQFANSNKSLITFKAFESTTITMVTITNSLFKFPTSQSRSTIETKKEYVSQLSISNSISGTVHVNIPIPSYIAPSSERVKQTFRCSVTLDFVQFQTETICKATKTSFETLPDIKLNDPSMIVDCFCDLSSLSRLADNSVIGITADYLETITPIVEKSTTDTNTDNNQNRNVESGDGAAALVLLIPVLICCGCFILIPVIVTIIIVKNKKKQQAAPANAPANTTVNAGSPQYDRVMTQSSISSGTPYDQYKGNNIAMNTYSESQLTTM